MANTENGDVRINNELSRKIDIEPSPYMTRKQWTEAVVMNLLLYGSGNSIVLPHTSDGFLGSLEVVSPSRVVLLSNTADRSYYVSIDGIQYSPDEVLHFVHNPDQYYPWKGKGFTVYLRDVANNLKQAVATEKGFMESKWKPSVIVKVDALTEEFSSQSGRKKLLESYVESAEVGEPWLIPAEQFQVEQVRPLTLSDLAIKDTVELDKKTVAAVIGVPAFLLGVGQYNREEWNSFIQSKVKYIAQIIEQEIDLIAICHDFKIQDISAGITDENPLIPVFFRCLGHGDNLIMAGRQLLQCDEVLILSIGRNDNSCLTPFICICQAQFALQAIAGFTHNESVGKHVVYQVLDIRIGSQRIGACYAFSKEIGA